MYETDYLKLKVAEENDFYNINEQSENFVKIDAKIKDMENEDLVKTALLDLIHPVGTIYTSCGDTSPEILFGGTWERIEDMFLLAAGKKYKAGETGGEALHMLGVTEMPEHGHGYSGTTGNDNNDHTHGFSANTGTVSADHTHNPTALDLAYSGEHAHTLGAKKASWNNGSGSHWQTCSPNEAVSGFTSYNGGNHTHTFANFGLSGITANHTHGVSGTTGGRSAFHQHAYSGTTAFAGSGTAHNNMPPYLVVYAWKRIA